MRSSLILLAAINWVVFAVLLVLRVRAAATYPTRRLRTLGWVGALMCAAFLLVATQRLGIHMALFGALPEPAAEYLMSVGQLVLSVAITVMVVSAVYAMNRVGREVSRADQMVSILSNRIPRGLSVSDLGLTAREIEVLEWMSEGKLSDAQIATAMSISPATAGTHVRNILQKAGISTRTDLVVLATKDIGPARSHD